MDELLEIAVAAAKEAGKIQMEYLGKDLDIAYKGEVNIVTKVDKLCERRIISLIQERYPDHDFLAEEERTSREHSKEYRWIIDPLDGTTNYAHSYRFFCTSIALEKGSEVILGVVYAPVTKELFHAEKGKGAFLNGERIKVSNIAELSKSLLCTGFPYDIRESKNNNIDYFNRLILKSQAVRRDGAAALDLCYVACGRFDGFWELKLQPWDVAAGSLIINEAGGVVTNFKNEELNIFKDDIVASNGLIHDDIVNVLLEAVS
jgi:myo-inositol-1(or 4)-monophosphatase